MTVETCEECGFDGAKWTEVEALAAVDGLPERWRHAIRGLDVQATNSRPIDGMWSIGEYTDHVRETIFGQRFILDIALANPGTDLGPPPEPVFTTEAATIDSAAALAAFEVEIAGLSERLRGLSLDQWSYSVIIDGRSVDAAWMVRHAVHDVTHHLGDVANLRERLGLAL